MGISLASSRGPGFSFLLDLVFWGMLAFCLGFSLAFSASFSCYILNSSAWSTYTIFLFSFYYCLSCSMPSWTSSFLRLSFSLLIFVAARS